MPFAPLAARPRAGRTLVRAGVACAVWTLCAASALADDVRLTNGSTVEGRATREGDVVVVRTRAGEVRLPAAEVAEIVAGPTRFDLYEARRKELEGGEQRDDADAHLALGDWCRDQRLDREARRHWQRAVELDPENRPAHGRLGHIRYDGRWLTDDEYHEARGFVRVDGKWVHRDELARERAAAAAAKAQEAHVRKVRDCVSRMASMKRRTRLLAKVELQEYAESIGDLRLASFASRVAESYNAQWARVRADLERGTVLTTVRATHSELKRPIPTLTTSLGANSTPVTIQLPELSIVSVKTTVLVPADIELDD